MACARGSDPGRRIRRNPRGFACACAFAALLIAAGPVRATDSGPAAAADSDSSATPFVLLPDSVVVPRGRARGQVLEPAGLAVDRFGRIYVSDAALHRLQRFGPHGEWIGEAGALGSRPGELRRPGSVALIGALGVAVLDRGNRRIAAYDLFGRFSGILVDLEDSALLAETGRIDPIALATDGGSALYLADADRDRILVFDFGGRFLRSLGGFGVKPGSFHGLAGLGVSSDGFLVTAERTAQRVQTLDANGRPMGAWSVPFAAGGDVIGVAISEDGATAFADPAAGRLWVFDRAGRPLAPPREAEAPRAVAFAGHRRLLIAEGDRIARYRLAPRADPKGN